MVLAGALTISALTLMPTANALVPVSVSGTVTGPGELPLESIKVVAQQEVTYDNGDSNWENIDFADTDSLGNYEFTGLADGTYRVEFGDRLNPNPYASEFWNDQATIETAQDVTVVAGTPVENIDAELALESTISGRVTGAENQPLAGAGVYVSERAGGEWAYLDEVRTDANGDYTLGHLPHGTYRVEFGYEVSETEYLSEAWNNKAYLSEADDIVVGENTDTAGIDAKLVAGEHDPLPFLEGVTIPQISGTPQVGSTLTVTKGTWNVPDSEITAAYQWVNDDGAIVGANAATYVPTTSDLGKSLVVLVDASAPGYQDRTNMSTVVGPIVAAPAPPVVTPPAVTPPVVAPAPTPVLSFSKKIDVAGALKVGSTLKLKNFKALVSRAAVTYKIQWFAGSKKIKKATKSKLKVTKALKGKKISVKVTAISGTTSKTVKVKVGKIK